MDESSINTTQTVDRTSFVTLVVICFFTDNAHKSVML